MDKGLYHRRSLIESINSAVKRKYGIWVKSRTWGRQFQEIVAKHFIYNTPAFPIIICTAIVFKFVKKDFYKAISLRKG